MNFKRTFAGMLMFAGFSLSATAEAVNDTLLIEEPRSVKIETNDTMQSIEVKGMKGNYDFIYTQKVAVENGNAIWKKIKNLDDAKKIKVIDGDTKHKKFDSDAYGFVGLGTMIGAPNGYNFKLWPSFELGLGICYEYRPFGKLNVWSLGFGVDLRYYRMSSDKYWVKDSQGVMSLADYSSKQSDRKTSMEFFSLQFPFTYTHYFGKEKGWGLTLGALFNINTGAHTNKDYTEDELEYEVKTYKIGQRPITVDFMGAINIPGFTSIYCKYSPMKAFKDNRGPKMQQLSFGFWL